MSFYRQVKVPIMGVYKGFTLYRTHGWLYALPPGAQVARIIYTPGLLDRHPAVLSAANLEELHRLVDGYDLLSLAREVLGRAHGYTLVCFRGAYYAVPNAAGDIDLDVPEDRQRAGVICRNSREELEQAVRTAAAGAPVEFAGWLPIFSVSGNCGSHPQFRHTGNPPEGYRFTRSVPPTVTPSRMARITGVVLAVGERAISGLAKAAVVAAFAVRSMLSLVFPRRGVSLATRVAVSVALVRLVWLLVRRGCRPLAVVKFLQTRHLQSQLLLGRQELVFLTSMPYTYGQNPWVIEIEDPTTLFYPLVTNGATSTNMLRDSPYFPIVKALLEADHCKVILTHMRSTAELVPALFGSEIIRKKVLYSPLGVRLPDRWQRHNPQPPDEPINLLFINSWCQVPENYYVRGGLDVLEAFAILRERYPRVRLTMRTALPPLSRHYQRIIESGDVRIVNRYVSDEEMAELHAGSHIFLLPAARVHIVSLLQAMSHGLAVVGSDGWGMEEYLENEFTGLVVKGRYGKASWADLAAGMLREDYMVTHTPDPEVVAGIVEAVSRLVEDPALRRRLGRAAREQVRNEYNLETWNRGLKAALDMARGVGQPASDVPQEAAGEPREPREAATVGRDS